MSKAEKEFTRRIKKMQKHVEALRSLVIEVPAGNLTVSGSRTVLDDIESSLQTLKGKKQMATAPTSF